MTRPLMSVLLAIMFNVTTVVVAIAQVENPDYRIRASMRDAGDHSVGNVEFRVKSRYGQVYYGGVVRQDEYRIVVGLDDSSFAHRDFDIYVGDTLLGRSAGDAQGYVSDTYRSDWKPDDAPDRRLPAGFSSMVTLGMLVSVHDPLSNAVLFSAALEESFRRGDVDQDGKVDEDDFAYLEQSYGLPGVGPARGDFTGDNFADAADYQTITSNWTDRDPPPAAPLLTGDGNFDGRVNSADFDIWMLNRFTAGAGATDGDFNDDGFVDGADFNVWSAYRLSSDNPAPSAVPEPNAALLAIALVCCFVRIVR